MDDDDAGPRYDVIIARVILLVSALIWGFFAAMGWSLTEAVRERIAPASPPPGQFEIYFVFPLVMAGLSLALFALSWRRRGGCLLATLGGLMLIILPFYLFNYTGGM